MHSADLKSILHERGLTLADLAGILSVNKSSVTRWAQKTVPPKRAIDIESATAGRIRRSDLRPDIWPGEENVA